LDSYDKLPDAEIKIVGEISRKFLELGINSFKQACEYVSTIEYEYNSNYDDKLIFFKEKKGTCTSKHAVIAGLAEELNIPLYKYVCVYKFTEEISTGANEILKKYDIPYVPMVHCFLVYENLRFDLTEGNCNGKNSSIEDCMYEVKVDPFISRKDEYFLFKKVLEKKVLPTKEMEGIKIKILLKARTKANKLLLQNMERQKIKRNK
jgi:hypothetical protein